MPITELKHFKISCDRCRWTMITVDTIAASIPSGWEYTKVGPCGMTDYYTSDLLCPYCLFDHRQEENKKTETVTT